MPKIHTLKIKNFRGISNFEQVFGLSEFICIIGRGDSGKTTVLEAISSVLCGSWNLSFHDTDFFEGNVEFPIEIEASLFDLPKRLLQEDKFGLYIRGLDLETNSIHDDVEDHHESLLTIRLTVEKDLEPKWCVVNNRQEPIDIRAKDRSSLNVFLVSEYIDRHFTWSAGSPLYSLLTSEEVDKKENTNVVIDALRDVKNSISEESFAHLNPILDRVKETASAFGVDISSTTTAIDFRDFSVKDGRISLHERNIPFRLKGKGSKRLISVALQLELVKSGGIILIDEIEQGLEPDRAQHVAKTLKSSKKGQIFITTHSRDVLVELGAENLFKMKKNATSFYSFDSSLQGLLRKNPEAFFAEKVLVCEGATEVGICRALNKHRIGVGKENASTKGIRFADGEGSSQFEYANNFMKAGYPVCLFCDSDKEEEKQKKEELRKRGVKVIDCEEGKAIENQLFTDLPWNRIKELLEYKTQDLQNKNSVEDCVKFWYKKKYGDLAENWRDVESPEIREVLGDAAKEKGWFKRIDHGEILGKACCGCLEEMNEKKIKIQFDEISEWIDNA